TTRHEALLDSMMINQTPGGLSGEGTEELQLGATLAEVIDELNIVKRLLDQQYGILRDALDPFRHGAPCHLYSEMKSGKAQVEALLSDGERLHQKILQLLDLKRQAASLREARAATQQGRAVMLFTIITTIFLPLSFFVSYFSQNVSELTGDPQNPTSGQVWKIAVSSQAPISVVVIVGSLAVAFFIMYPNYVKPCLRRLKISKPNPV
ncbi:hypothetical protein GCG54_00007668, partial [Colletotrichum gloeosporioides]